MNTNYDPFTFQPLERWFYEGQHYGAVGQFAEWLRANAPAAYAKVAAARPDLLNAKSALAGMTASGANGVQRPGGLAGLGDAGESPITSWGNQLLDLAKGYMAYDAQKDLLAVNLSRAERGQPPISAGSIAPQVNVGVSPEMQQLSYVAVGGLLLFGLVSAFRKRR